jgi:glucose/arabinose dehydrogenase
VKSKPAGLLTLLVILGLLLPAPASADFTVPNGFVDQPVVGGVPAPTAIDWLPSGQLLIATQGGVLYRWNGTGAAQPILDLSGDVCVSNEMGLLGLAVDPAFSGNPFIYLYYTDKKGGGGCDAANRANRVSRFTVDGNGNVRDETVLIDNIAAPGSNHNAGDLQFDRQSLLYVSVGDGGSTPDTARRLNTLNGKILRINRNGGIPADNPYTGNGTERCNHAGRASNQTNKCQEIYATGLRNPFRIAFDPDSANSRRFFINDVGLRAWEEIDEGAPGADFGWNIREGPCLRDSTTNCPQPSGFVEPIHAYTHEAGCRTITGGAFVPDRSTWPAANRDDYLFADLACETIFALDVGSRAVKRFATGSGAVHVSFGSDGALYYTTYEGGGQVRRIGVSSSPASPAGGKRDHRKRSKGKKSKGKKCKDKKNKIKKSRCKKGKHNGGSHHGKHRHRRR